MHQAMVGESRVIRTEDDRLLLRAIPGEQTFWDSAINPLVESEYAWALARDGLEDIGLLRSIRQPRGREIWNQPLREEGRLFAQLDALLAGGPDVLTRARDSVLQQIELPPDPEWIFAVTLALGCDGSPDSTVSLLAVFRYCCGLEPVAAEAAVEALWLAPENAVFAGALRDLLCGGTSDETARAAQVLGGRGELDEGDACALLDCSEPLALAAALEAAVDRGYRSVLFRVPEFYCHRERTVQISALRAGFAANLPGAHGSAVESCCELNDPGELTLCLAMFGQSSDFDIFQRLATGKTATAALRGAGYWGYAEIIPVLLKAMQAGSDCDRLAAAEAFERITGAGLLARADLDDEPVINPEAFEKWWHHHHSDFQTGIRYRRGQLLAAEALIFELSQIPMDPSDRWLVHLELTALSSLPPPHFRPWDFIARQGAAIRLWRRRFGFHQD